jgi:hypothetical protein
MAQSLASIDVAAKSGSPACRGNADLVADALAPATPDDVLAALECDVPIVLLPVRVETRVLQQPGGSWSLCVRVYPDGIHVDSHEAELTASEQDAGIAFWASLVAERDAAWRGQVDALGAQRAAWFAEATRIDPKTADESGRARSRPRAPLVRSGPRRSGSVPVRGARRWRGRALKDLRPRGLKIALHAEGQLLDVALAPQARELGAQLDGRSDKTLILAIEEKTDLA